MSCLILFCKNMNNKINMDNEVFLYRLIDVLFYAENYYYICIVLFQFMS